MTRRAQLISTPGARIIALGPFPPPIHGAAAVNAAVCDQASSQARVHRLDTAIRGSGKLGYHLRRALRHLAASAVIGAALGSGRATVYITAPGGMALWYLLLPLALGRLRGHGIVVHHHSFAYLDRARVSMRAVVWFGGRHAYHVVLCGAMATRFNELYRPVTTALVCSNAAWVAASASTPQLSPRRGALRVGHLGTLSEDKGLATVGELVVALVRAGVDAELHLVGSAPAPEDAALLKTVLGELGSRATHHGVLEGARKAEFFATLDLFAFPSRYRHEAEPLVVLEALAAGVPVATTARGCLAEQVGDGGLVVESAERFVAATREFALTLARDPLAAWHARTVALARFAASRESGLVQRAELIAVLAGAGAPGTVRDAPGSKRIGLA